MEQILEDLPVASRILAHQGVVDAFGHVSARNPENDSQFIMSRNMAPADVKSKDDLVVYNIEDAKSVDPDAPQGFLERMLYVALDFRDCFPV